MNDIRVERKVFFAWGEEKELEWLSKMARQGWELGYAGFCVYHFKKTEKQELNFSLDYRVLNNEDLEDYILHFESCGWQYISSVANWHYFKSKREETLYPDIYSENASKIEKYRRLLLTLILATLPSIWAVVFNVILLNEEFSLFVLFIVLFIFAADVFLVYGIFRIYRILQRLKRQ